MNINPSGENVYDAQVRPIGAKVMTFHLDVLDAAGQPVRATFSTLYSATAESATAADCGGGENTKRKPASLAPKVCTLSTLKYTVTAILLSVICAYIFGICMYFYV